MSQESFGSELEAQAEGMAWTVESPGASIPYRDVFYELTLEIETYEKDSEVPRIWITEKGEKWQLYVLFKNTQVRTVELDAIRLWASSRSPEEED
jgi:hypothetical protein